MFCADRDPTGIGSFNPTEPSPVLHRGCRAGNGILLSTGAQWHRNRKLLTKLFFFQKLQHYLPRMNDLTEQMVAELRTEKDAGQPREPFPVLMHHTMRMICLLAFGGRVDAEKALQLYETLSQRFQHEYILTHMALGDTLLSWLWWFPLVSRTMTTVEEIRTLISRSIAHRRAELSSSTDDLLGLMLDQQSRDPSISDNEIIEEARTFLFAGHDTTAHLLNWALYFLGKNPVWQDRLREEALAVVGTGPVEDEHLPLLHCTRAVLFESSRLRGPAITFDRVATVDTELAGHFIPRDTGSRR